MPKPTLAPAPRVPQPAPKGNPARALSAFDIAHHDDFDQRASGSTFELEPAEAAFGLDFIGRLFYRRPHVEATAWAQGGTLVSYLYGLRQVIESVQVDSDTWTDLRTFIAESVEYAAMRAGMGMEDDAARLARWKLVEKAAPEVRA